MRKHTVIAALMLVVLLVLSVVQVSATTLRGRVDGQRSGYMQIFPVPHIRVDLFQNRGGQWVRVSVAITGPDGMYYFEGVPPGMFMLLLNGMNQYPLRVAPMPMQDIPPLLLRY